jgi:hypothetical protein
VEGDPVNFNDPGGLQKWMITYHWSSCSWNASSNTLACSQYDTYFIYSDGGGGGGRLPSITDPGGGGGGNGGREITFEQAFKVARQSADDIAEKKKWSEECEGLLASLGTSSTAIAAAASRAIFIEAPGSTVSYASLYSNTALAASASAQWGSTTVSDYVGQNPATKALAELNGNRVYLNQKWWGGGYYEDMATVMHELVHNVTGLTDSDIEGKLKRHIAEFSPLLKTKCF